MTCILAFAAVMQAVFSLFLVVFSCLLYRANDRMRRMQADQVKFGMPHLLYHRLSTILDIKSKLGTKVKGHDDEEFLKQKNDAEVVFKKVFEELQPELYYPRIAKETPKTIFGRVSILVRWVCTGQIPPATHSCLHALLIKCLCKGEDVANAM